MPKKFLQCCKSSRTQNRFPSLGIWQQNWKSPGKQTLGGHNKTFCVPGPRRKEQWTQKGVSQNCWWVSVSLWWRCGLTATCCGVRGTEYNSPGSRWHMLTYVFWRRSPLLPLPLPQFGLRPNYREGTQPHPSAENCIKNLLSIALPTRVRTTSSPSHQEDSTSLLSSSIRSQTEWKSKWQKTNQTVHTDHSIV